MDLSSNLIVNLEDQFHFIEIKHRQGISLMLNFIY